MFAEAVHSRQVVGGDSDCAQRLSVRFAPPHRAFKTAPLLAHILGPAQNWTGEEAKTSSST